jgi:hypothetical protein
MSKTGVRASSGNAVQTFSASSSLTDAAFRA